MREVLIAAIALSFSGAPALAQSPDWVPGPVNLAQSVKRATRSEVARAAKAQQPREDVYRPGGMSPAYFWTGIGLMALGGTYIIGGALIDTGDSGLALSCEELDVDCDGVAKAMIGIGAGMVAAGGAVYIIGKNKARQSNPHIVIGVGHVILRSRLSF